MGEICFLAAPDHLIAPSPHQFPIVTSPHQPIPTSIIITSPHQHIITSIIITSFLLLYGLAHLALAWRLARIPPDDALVCGAQAPEVTVLVAARNEADNLPRCLASLAALDYPAAKLRVLIADDASTDATPRILRDFVRDRPTWQVLTITETLGHARGKANALAHLIRRADTELLLCCDADVAVPPTWVRSLVAEAQRTGAAIVVGTTLIEGPGWLAAGQRLDWLRALAALRVAASTNRAFTGMGNNQLLRRAAYQATGGYEALPFSVTEDFQLFLEISRQGGRTTHVFGAAALAWSAPATSFGALLRQRRRWLRGLARNPRPRLVATVIAEGAVFPALLILAFGGSPLLALSLWGFKWLSKALLLRLAARRVAIPQPSPGQLLGAELYQLFLAATLPIAFLWPGAVRWKGRDL